MVLTASSPAIRVFLVEDSAPVRERIAALIAEIDGVLLLGHADTAAGATAAILSLRPDVVLLDIHLAEGSGIDVLQTVHASLPAIVFIVVTNLASAPYREKCLAAGASHFIDKSTESADISRLLAALVATRRQHYPQQDTTTRSASC